MRDSTHAFFRYKALFTILEHLKPKFSTSILWLGKYWNNRGSVNIHRKSAPLRAIIVKYIYNYTVNHAKVVHEQNIKIYLARDYNIYLTHGWTYRIHQNTQSSLWQNTWLFCVQLVETKKKFKKAKYFTLKVQCAPDEVLITTLYFFMRSDKISC